MITTYFTNNEQENYKTVSDVELNRVLQEVRAFNPDYYVKENVLYEKKFWFSKTAEIPKFSYLLYYKLSDTEYQVLNFAHETENNRTCRMHVTRSLILTYFYGYLQGIKPQPQTNQINV
jgi:hypothetical protein